MAMSLQKLCLVFISVFVVFFASPPPSLSHRIQCHSHESQALLRFKAALNDSQGVLSSWVNGTDCCTNWIGISCNSHTNHVVSLEIDSTSIQGVISESLCQLRFLTSLGIFGDFIGGGRKITGTLPPCLGNLSYIQQLDLSRNKLSGMIPSSICFLTRLTLLDLHYNELNESIPSCLGNLSSLTHLDLHENQLSGNIPFSLGSLTLLRFLLLGGNPLSGNIPNSLGNLSSLEKLYLAYTQLSGTIPHSFAQLSFLTDLSVDGNRFNETVASSSLPPSLVHLSLSLNHSQQVSETLFQNLTRLKKLYLSDSELNISKTWIPSFNLTKISVVSCMINGEIPTWISTQFSLDTLKLVDTGLVGEIPSWLWETNSLLQNLNLSGNHLEGTLLSNTSIWMQLETLDVSKNALSAHIPSIWSPNLKKLLANDNSFSGNIPSSLGRLSELSLLNLANNNLVGVIPTSLGRLSQLLLLNLANNNLTGVIPTSLFKCSFLNVINLGNNSLKGGLPHEFSKLSELYSLVVHRNNLHGPFPQSIVNCSKLQVLDIGNNLFGGEIPKFVGNFSKLRVLVMKENNFTGSIPPEIGQLSSLQILLLSSNHLSGSIPHTIVSLQAMSIESQDGFVLSSSNIYYRDGLDMVSKGTEQHYEYILSTLTSIDLSNNELEGEVASNFGNLKGLRLLNLSMNNLNGNIPNSLGEMSQLESLDLSRNHFSGKIPIEFESLNSLGSLNLSNNNLSGSIPQGQHIADTFGESSYLGNPYLWGCPLPKNCSWPQVSPPSTPIFVNKEKESTKYSWYKILVGLSYGVAFGGTLSLILIRVSWQRKYFSEVDKILKFLFPWMKNLTL